MSLKKWVLIQEEKERAGMRAARSFVKKAKTELEVRSPSADFWSEQFGFSPSEASANFAAREQAPWFETTADFLAGGFDARIVNAVRGS